MHNKKPRKLLTAQETPNAHGGPLERVMRKARKDHSKSAVEDKEKDETLHDCDKGKTPASDLTRLCRPLSIYLTRLPESLVNKNVVQKNKPVKKRKSPSCWKNGFSSRKDSRSRTRKRKAGQHPQPLQSQTDEIKSKSDGLVMSDVTSMSLNVAETSTAGLLPSDDEEPAGGEDQTEKITASLEGTSTSLANGTRLLEAQECSSSNGISINAAPARSDTFPNPEESELPEERELKIDESWERAGTPATTTIEDTDDRTSLAEENYNGNSTVSQPLEEQTDRSIARHTRKRKNTSLSESSAPQRGLQHPKKARSLLSTSESSALPLEERNATVSEEIAVTDPQQPVLLANAKNARITKERVRTKTIRPIHEVAVVVNRLDDSRSPLVEKWKNRVDLSQLDGVTSNLRETWSGSTSSLNQLEKENEQELEPTITGHASEGMTTYSPALMDLPSSDIHANTDIVMCDSNEDGSEEDDDEIIEFLAARQTTKSPTKITHHEDKSNGELDEEQRLLQPSVKTPPANRSNSRFNVKRTRGRRRHRIRSCSTTDDGKSEISSYSVKSSGTRSKTPALRKTRKSRRPSYPKSDASSCEENISPPLTRSRSRAAVDHSYHEESMNFNDLFHQKRRKRYRISYNSDSSDKADETNEKIYEDETQFEIDSTQNVHDVVESERIEENVDSVVSANVNDSDDDSTNSNDVFHEKRHQKMLLRIYYSDSSNEANEANVEINENENQVVLDNRNVQDVVANARIEPNDDSLNSAAAIDSNVTLIDTLQLKRDDDEENCIARRKLATMKDAMVVLTRLEDLANQCSDGDIGLVGKSDYDFPSNSIYETHEDDNANVSTDNVNATLSLSRRSIDLLRTGNQSLNSGEMLDYSIPQFVPQRDNRQDYNHSPRNKQIKQDHRPTKVPKQCVELESGTSPTRTDSACQEMSESDDEGQLMVDESVPAEERDSDVEPTLIIDECGKTAEPMTRSQSEEVPIDAVGNSDILKSPPGPKTPRRDLAGLGKPCNCKEQQGNDGHHDCQNISPSLRCTTCEKFFKNSSLLEEHKSSSALCGSTFRCSFCKSVFNTSIELLKHRSSCSEKKLRRKNPAHAKTHEEIAAHESENSVASNSEAPRSKKKKQKQASSKNPPKKNRGKTRCRSDNLTCGVCSANFDTKTDLSEHLYKHSQEEHQEAYRAAKAKAIADSQAEQAAKRTDANSDMSSDKTADNQVSSDTMIPSAIDESLTQNLGAHEAQIMSSVDAMASNTFNHNLLASRPANVCFCHRDVDPTSLEKSDLQIEMVLLCKYCHVIFRRRECLEVHYRASSICSVNRTRERCPSLFCANCQSTLNSWADMRQHLELHANQNSERTIRFVCNICRVVFVGFGALFYNHWTSHSKDSMFVAGRYNFPKFSVQTINGTEKLPAGARADENYIFVAEHVCATCKEPFSTRRDLEKHQQSESCTKQIPTQAKSNTNTKPSERSNKAPPRVEKTKIPLAKTGQEGTNLRNNVNPIRQSPKRNHERPPTKTPSAGEQHLIKTRMFCDVCDLAFINEHWLSMHSKNMHENRFTFVPTTLSGTPLALPFKCNECSAFAASVSAIEEHWRTDVLHKGSAALIKPKKPSRSSKTTGVTSSTDRTENIQIPLSSASVTNVNRVTLTDKSKTLEEPPIITIDDLDSNSDSRASGDVAMNQNVLAHNEESVISMPFITSTESSRLPNINGDAVLCDPLNHPPLPPNDTGEQQRAKIRALEDPCVNVILSGTSGTNLSASLVIPDAPEKTKENILNRNAESYRILLPNPASPGNIKMIFSRKSSTDSASEPEKISRTGPSVVRKDEAAQAEGSNSTVPVGSDGATTRVPLAGSPVTEKDKVGQTESSDSRVPVGSEKEPTPALLTESTAVGNNEIVQTKGSHPIAPVESNGELTPTILTESNNVAPTESTDSRRNAEPNLITTPPITTLESATNNCPGKATDTFILPEIIDIFDDTEECGKEQHTGQAHPTAAKIRDDLFIGANEALKRLLESRKSMNHVHKHPSKIVIDSSPSLRVDNAQKASESGSGSESSLNPAISKANSPGRSKMIKAVMKLSSVSFEEERWSWVRSSSANRDSVAFTEPKKQGFLRVKDLSELQAAKNYTCVICNRSFESEKLLDEHRRMPMCGGSIQGRDSQYPRGISAALVLPDPSERPKTPESNLPPLLASMPNQTTSTLMSALLLQPDSYPQRVSAPSAQSIQTTSHFPNIPVNNTSLGSWTSIGNTAAFGINPNQPQDNQPCRNLRSTLLSGGSMRTQDSNQGLPEMRNSSVGYHTLPPMVGLPTGQTNKHQHAPPPQRIPSNNPTAKLSSRHAPLIIQQPDKTSKFLCTICHTFECTSLEAIKDHLKKHYHGWKNSTVTQNSSQAAPVARAPAPPTDPLAMPSLGTTQDGRQILSKNMNAATNRPPVSDCTIKMTPQGPVLVRLPSEWNNERMVLRQSSLNANNLAPNPLYNSQLVFRCRICKSAVYKSYPPLRDHAILVHGIADFNLLDQGNIAQNSYLCTQCPNTQALFDTDEEYREHVDSIHTHSCPSCQRVFTNFLTLRHHLEQCRVSTASNRNTYGNNC